MTDTKELISTLKRTYSRDTSAGQAADELERLTQALADAERACELIDETRNQEWEANGIAELQRRLGSAEAENKRLKEGQDWSPAISASGEERFSD